MFPARPSHTDPAFLRTRSRLNACAFTLSQTLLDIEDPRESELRADLLIAIEDVLNSALALHAEISEMVWHELDVSAHPAGKNKLDSNSHEFEED